MTTPDNLGSGSPSSMVFRGLLSLRRGAQVASMEQGQELDIDPFHSHLADRLLALLPRPCAGGDPNQLPPPPPLSLAFLSKLLDALLSCEDEFRVLLARNHAGLLGKPPADRAVNDLLDRAVKSLDVCNSVSFSLHSLRHWHRQALIAASSLLPDNIGEGPLNRARRALSRLFASSPDSPSAAIARSEGSGSSGRSGGGGSGGGGHARALSWSVSKNWAAARQMPPVPTNLVALRGGEAGGAGMALAVYAMSSLLAFAMWALAAAVPGGDRAPPSPVSPRQNLPWAGPMAVLQERISDEWRRRRGASSLLAEIQEVERCGRELMEAVGEGGQPPSKTEELAAMAADLAEACRRLEEGLGPLERQVREVFHRVIGNRAEVLRCVDQSARTAAAPPNAPLIS